LNVNAAPALKKSAISMLRSRNSSAVPRAASRPGARRSQRPGDGVAGHSRAAKNAHVAVTP
jgi:hypothetical protein